MMAADKMPVLLPCPFAVAVVRSVTQPGWLGHAVSYCDLMG